jgi:Cof subfamily protein (haloacid dehalogenase superfamily)
LNTPRIAFVDIDGTILDSNGQVAPSTVDAVQLARANGHLVYLCTGRASVEIPLSILDIGFDGAISAGGGFAEIGRELVISRAMPEAAVARMVDFFEVSGYDFYLHSYDAMYPSPGVQGRFAAYLEKFRAQQPELALAGAPASADRYAHSGAYSFEGIAKSVFLASDLDAFDRVQEALNDEFHVITGTIPHMGRGSGEVTLKGVNKGTTIVQLLELLELDASSAIGIGDNSNDIEMLQVCGVGVAMGNAIDEIKAHADQVTTSVTDDGVWNAFRKNNLI